MAWGVDTHEEVGWSVSLAHVIMPFERTSAGPVACPAQGKVSVSQSVSQSVS
jgi:hypothetical protein